MKLQSTFLTLALAGVWQYSIPALAIKPPGIPAGPEIELAEPEVQAAKAEVEAAKSEVNKAVAAIAETTAEVTRQVEHAVNSAGAHFNLAQAHGGAATTRAGMRHAFGASYVNSTESPTVIATSTPEPGELADWRVDLTVMAKLVNDAIQEDRDDDPARSAMGLIVKWLPGGSPGNDVYVEGSGAIIQTSVRYPLLAPKVAPEPPAAESNKKSAWDDARRELYGGKKNDSVEIAVPPDKRPEFSAERVDALKQTILKALASANNFRHMGGDETVTVVVRSRLNSHSQFVFFQTDAFQNHTSVEDKGDEDATMTIRVKKSDADALAAGKINDEEFRKRAKVAIY